MRVVKDARERMAFAVPTYTCKGYVDAFVGYVQEHDFLFCFVFASQDTVSSKLIKALKNQRSIFLPPEWVSSRVYHNYTVAP